MRGLIVSFRTISFLILSRTRRKRLAREPHKRAEYAKKVHGIKAKLYNKRRRSEKIAIKKL